jgi:pantothenate synthetase
MSSRRKAAAKLAREIGVAEKLIAQGKRDRKKTKTKLARSNKKRALKAIQKAVEVMEDYKDEVRDSKVPPVS